MHQLPVATQLPVYAAAHVHTSQKMSKRKVFRDSDDDLESENEGSDIQEEEDGEEENQVLAESDSDSDAAPEDVGFSQSKESALKKVTDALNSIKQQKQKLKDRRKDKEDTYKQQKKQKLDALANSRLPEDFLKNIKSAPLVNAEEKQEAYEEENQDEGSLGISDEDFSGEESGDEKGDEGFIPVGTSHVKAVYVKDHVKSALTSAERAAAFKKDQLYGKKVQRESFKSLQNKTKKKHARY